MKTLIATVVVALSFTLPFLAKAQDPDLDAIIAAVQSTPCSQVQVLAAKNIAAIRWDRGSERFLYGDDIAALRDATLKAGKRVIDVDKEFDIPNLNDPNWGTAYDTMNAELIRIFDEDYASHPPDGC